ncbi:MAG TPA: multidrug ABC transporter permease [Polaromonas sp.]|jgi:ABC-2 type transport system permease protein|uniref:ABC transporter permease n=1 Tax=Polaromonas sp. UBA4122 TaxID=1947074 RepID=UPI000ED8197F|nr:ABC transporter permease [Polaromonas sp. UBA4122]HAL37398.1 multidrug ABC transporter permease [Polaromonas sp.]
MLNFVRETAAVADAEVRKLMRDPSDLLSRAVQPVLWLAVFGQVFSQVRGMPTGNLRYLDYMAPGILAQSILFSAIFYGIAIIWERDLGIVHKLLVTPAHRSALVLGKAVAAGLRGLVQATVVYLVAIALEVNIRWEPLPMLTVAAGVVLGSCIFSTFSLVIACLVKTRERFMGIGQVLTMPLFFASNALYPLDLMPAWLKTIAVFNPLTYLVDVLRGAMIVGGRSIYAGSTSFGVMLLVFAVLLALASKLYPGLAH